MESSFYTLVAATISIAFFHSVLGPDHYLPFIVLAKSSGWSKSKLLFITFLSGVGHVLSSVVLGIIGILLGFGLKSLEGIESTRSDIGAYLFIGFGVAYMIWGFIKSKHHHHHDISNKKIITFWTLFAIFVLGPCEPLIPIMFAATRFNWYGIIFTSVVFSIITIGMMMLLSYFGFLGINLFNTEKIHKYSHSIAGGIIAISGVLFIVL